MTTLVWFRNDLRLADNPALYQALERGGTIVPVFIWAPDEEGDWPPGAAQLWWLHHSLSALDADLRAKGSRLLIRKGPGRDTLRDLIDVTGADAVYWNERYTPALARRDIQLSDNLKNEGIDIVTFPVRLLHNPSAIRTTSGGPYHVFTPFWKKLQAKLDVPAPLPIPRMGATRSPDAWPSSLNVDELDLLPEIDWTEGFRNTWTPGEAAAQERLAYFVEHLLIDYEDHRNRPDLDGTSMLSPYLHHGELSPRQVWHAVKHWIQNAPMQAAAQVYLSEIAWRDFSYHLLVHYPETPAEPLKEKFGSFAWKTDADALERWQKGQTGYPIVDAGMRQLWHIGWMHNRVRMIVASFLTKDLLIPWQDGARWFWNTLVDADLANNTMGWQWSAGCGADAQPFFRIFNPISQGKRYDPKGNYIRRWIPELSALPDTYIYRPWEAPVDVLADANVILGEDYPEPIVDHAAARNTALAAYQQIR
ncbi:MAG TPA: deoxyribodipyrimidine photo-lyase [Rhodothermales bacterium]|nr:deoxyribodipyrimidine photo-lyase [Rhodothermales bacterium]